MIWETSEGKQATRNRGHVLDLEENAEKPVQSGKVPNDHRRWNHEEQTDDILRGLERPHATRDYMFAPRVYECSDIATSPYHDSPNHLLVFTWSFLLFPAGMPGSASCGSFIAELSSTLDERSGIVLVAEAELCVRSGLCPHRCAGSSSFRQSDHLAWRRGLEYSGFEYSTFWRHRFTSHLERPPPQPARAPTTGPMRRADVTHAVKMEYQASTRSIAMRYCCGPGVDSSRNCFRRLVPLGSPATSRTLDPGSPAIGLWILACLHRDL